MIFGLDRHYYPLTIGAGVQIVIKTTPVTLTPGVYYAHNDAGAPSGYPSLYRHICARLGAVYGGTWSVSPILPAGYALRSGVRLSVTGASGTEYIDFDLTSAIVKQVLGWPSTVTGAQAFTAGALDGPRAAYGSWAPWSAFDGRATSKDSTRGRVTAWSSDHPEVAVPIVWRDRRMRLMVYQYVFGTYIINTRNNIADLVAQGKTALGDTHNSLDHLWAQAGLTLGTILVSHDATVLDLDVVSRPYDLVKLGSRAAAEALDQIATRNGLASDLWDVRLPYVVIGGTYGL